MVMRIYVDRDPVHVGTLSTSTVPKHQTIKQNAGIADLRGQGPVHVDPKIHDLPSDFQPPNLVPQTPNAQAGRWQCGSTCTDTPDPSNQSSES